MMVGLALSFGISSSIVTFFSIIAVPDADFSNLLEVGPYNYWWFDFISITSIIAVAVVIILAVILVPYYIRKRIGKESISQ